MRYELRHKYYQPNIQENAMEFENALTTKQLAAIMKMTPQGVRNRHSMGRAMPESIFIGRQRLYLKKSVDEYIEKCSANKKEDLS